MKELPPHFRLPLSLYDEQRMLRSMSHGCPEGVPRDMWGHLVSSVYARAWEWSARTHTDGEIPRYALGRLVDAPSLPDPVMVADALSVSGLWQATGEGWLISDYATLGETNADRERKARDAEERTRYERERKRRRRAELKAAREAAKSDGGKGVPRDVPAVSRGTSRDGKQGDFPPPRTPPSRALTENYSPPTVPPPGDRDTSRDTSPVDGPTGDASPSNARNHKSASQASETRRKGKGKATVEKAPDRAAESLSEAQGTLPGTPVPIDPKEEREAAAARIATAMAESASRRSPEPFKRPAESERRAAKTLLNAGYAESDILNMVTWCEDDDFWSTVIFDVKKLHEHRKTVAARMRSGKRSPGGNNRRSSARDVAEELATVNGTPSTPSGRYLARRALKSV